MRGRPPKTSGVVRVARKRLVDGRNHRRRLVRRLVRVVIEAHRLEAVGKLEPLRSIAEVDVIRRSEVRGVDGTIGLLEIGDR
jgi:hypothetical protein